MNYKDTTSENLGTPTAGPMDLTAFMAAFTISSLYIKTSKAGFREKKNENYVSCIRIVL